MAVINPNVVGEQPAKISAVTSPAPTRTTQLTAGTGGSNVRSVSIFQDGGVPASEAAPTSPPALATAEQSGGDAPASDDEWQALQHRCRSLQTQLINALEDAQQYRAEYLTIQQDGRKLYARLQAQTHANEELTSRSKRLQTELQDARKAVKDANDAAAEAGSRTEEWKAKYKEQAAFVKTNLEAIKNLKEDYSILSARLAEAEANSGAATAAAQQEDAETVRRYRDAYLRLLQKQAVADGRLQKYASMAGVYRSIQQSYEQSRETVLQAASQLQVFGDEADNREENLLVVIESQDREILSLRASAEADRNQICALRADLEQVTEEKAVLADGAESSEIKRCVQRAIANSVHTVLTERIKDLEETSASQLQEIETLRASLNSVPANPLIVEKVVEIVNLKTVEVVDPLMLGQLEDCKQKIMFLEDEKLIREDFVNEVQEELSAQQKRYGEMELLLKDTVARYEEAGSKMCSNIEELNAHLSELRSEVYELSEEKEQLAQQCTEWHFKATSEVDSVQAKNDALRKELSDARQRCLQLASDNTQQNLQLRQLREQLDQLVFDRTAHEKQHAQAVLELQTDLQSAEQNVQILHSLVEKLRECFSDGQNSELLERELPRLATWIREAKILED